MSEFHHDTLSERELEVLAHVAAGLSNKSIAEKLFLSPNTVAWYIQQIFSKLHVERRTQAVAVARSSGILNPALSDTPTQTSIPRQKSQHNLPRETTSFIGRESEIDAILSLLNRNNCRLLTLVGQGGIGKTRLALAVAKKKLRDFADGIFFIALQPLTSADKIVPTISNAIGLKILSSETNPHEQLLAYLETKSVLLLLDNFEHLIDSSKIVSEILRATNDVKILISSREALNLQEEFLYSVNGLQFPESIDATLQEGFSAIELFNQRALQIWADFSLDEQWLHVVKICSLVDGIPLALELAVSWLKSLSCEEIAAEIQKGLDILVTHMRNVPERHRSMQAVFDYSWQLLTSEEQDVFKALSVFRGGCIRKAAQFVTGADIHILQSLTDKSFIRRDTISERFDIHELMRQYGEYHLNQSIDECIRFHDLHCEYYVQLLADSGESTRNENQYDLMIALDMEVDNIRVAWNWAIEQSNLEAIQKAAQTLWVYLIFRGRFLEGAEAFESAIQVCEDDNQHPNCEEILAELKNLCGMFYIRMSRLDDASNMFKASHQLYQKLETALPIGWVTEPIIGMSIIETAHGNYGEAEILANRAVEICTEQPQGMNLILAHYVATAANFHQGKYQTAQYHAQQAYQMCVEMGELWVRAEVLIDLGRIARELQDYPCAQSHFKASFKIRKMFEDSQGVAAALNHLGNLAILDEDYQDAKLFFEQGYDLYNEIGDKGGIGYALNGLGTVALNQTDLQKSANYFGRALQIADSSHYAPLVFSALIGCSQLFWHHKQPQRSLELLSLIYHDEHSDQQAKDEAKRIFDNLSDKVKLEPDAIDTIWLNGQLLELESVIRETMYYVINY